MTNSPSTEHGGHAQASAREDARPTISGEAPEPRGAPRNVAAWERQLDALILEQLQDPFRGEIWENVAGVPMERGFQNEGQPFDIGTANYLREPLRALRERTYGKFVFLGAVQTLKTFGCLTMPAGYFIEHDPGDMTIFLPEGESAFDEAKGRLVPYLKKIPGVGRAVDIAERHNRFDITTAEFYLPNMILRVWPLNENSTQRVTLRYVLISDAFLSGRKGLIEQAIRRTTQHNTIRKKDYKIIIESQGGEVDDDFDLQWKTTDMRVLHVKCPQCDSTQPFDWHRERQPAAGQYRPPAGDGGSPQGGFRAVLPKKQVWEIVKKHCGPFDLVKNYRAAQEWLKNN